MLDVNVPFNRNVDFPIGTVVVDESNGNVLRLARYLTDWEGELPLRNIPEWTVMHGKGFGWVANNDVTGVVVYIGKGSLPQKR